MAGFTPLECLIQATKNNSEILMIDDQVGDNCLWQEGKPSGLRRQSDENIEVLNQVALVLKAGQAVQR